MFVSTIKLSPNEEKEYQENVKETKHNLRTSKSNAKKLRLTKGDDRVQQAEYEMSNIQLSKYHIEYQYKVAEKIKEYLQEVSEGYNQEVNMKMSNISYALAQTEDIMIWIEDYFDNEDYLRIIRMNQHVIDAAKYSLKNFMSIKMIAEQAAEKSRMELE